jgi:fatty-acyl-CoA synthase
MRSTMMDYPLTLVRFLERAGRYFPDTEIVSRMPDKSLHRESYGDFYRRARALAAALTRAGLKKGDRVATLMWNHYAHLEAYFGVPVSAGVLHTLNLRLHPQEIAYIVNHAEDRFLIVDDILLPLYEQFRSQVNFERVIVVRLTGNPTPDGFDDYEKFIAPGGDAFTYPTIDEKDPLGMCYTSGTTGKPLGVVYSHRSTVLHAMNVGLADAIGTPSGTTYLTLVPMFHVNAWGAPYINTALGIKQVFPGPYYDAESILDLMEREQVGLAAGVPTLWMGVLQALEREPKRWRLLPGLTLVVGGSAAPEAMMRAFDRLGITLLHAWGMTETSPMGTVSRLKPKLEKLGEDQRYAIRVKQGLPALLVELRVMANDKEVPPDDQTMGEIEVRGPFISGGYYKTAPSPEKFSPDGWLRTGDIAVVDAEGYVKIVDRSKDVIKSGGEWISSLDLENFLMGHPAVAEAAVIAVPHPKWDERPLAVIVLKPGQSATPEQLAEFLRPKVPKWWLPDAYVFTDAIPRGSTGKFLKSRLRDLYGKGAPSAAGKAG